VSRSTGSRRTTRRTPLRIERRAQTCFTPDSYPVVDFLRENVYAILDSNHGFKMLALGKLAAAEILGLRQPELDTFRLSRFAAGALHPASSSPYPWT